MGAYLAKAGVSCVVFERELFPRPHVGESLVPSAMRVFRDLDFLGQMEEAKFPHKFGAAWTAEDQGAYEMNFQGGFKDQNQINPESHVVGILAVDAFLLALIKPDFHVRLGVNLV